MGQNAGEQLIKEAREKGKLPKTMLEGDITFL